MMNRHLKDIPSKHDATRPRKTSSHQARRLARLSNELYYTNGSKVYMLDTYRYHGELIAIVSLADDSGIFEVSYDKLVSVEIRD